MKIPLCIAGLGIAGQARIKAASNSNFFELKALASRRQISNFEIKPAFFEDCLLRDDIQAVAISTENTQHARMVELALEHHKHVLCDYPLALSESEARKVYQLAKSKNLICHTEHIGLLMKDHINLKNKIRTKGSIKKVKYHFQGRWNSKLNDKDYTGPQSFLMISPLLQVHDLFGSYSMKVEEKKINSDSYKFKAILQSSDELEIEFIYERSGELKRQRRLQVEWNDDTYDEILKSKNENLFFQDLEYFGERIKKQKAAYYDEEAMLSIIGLLENL